MGNVLYETEPKFMEDIACYPLTKNTWMEGYWQSEKYFSDFLDVIARDLAPPEPAVARFLDVAKIIESCNAVAVGVRVFEEVPDDVKSGVGGVAPLSFYEKAANQLAHGVVDPVFFVFCTTSSTVENKLRLPGPISYITHDNGFVGAIQRLWLISRCRHHILSNSSFYWWGAWLAERQACNHLIIAADMFPNSDTIPQRWLRLPAGSVARPSKS